jgi:catechol 2,3-dioxygenase-like lactoylglutathione lyase family enzyme
VSKLISALALLLSAPAIHKGAQLSPPNPAGVTMGHLHYHVRDVEANKRFWVELGGEAISLGPEKVMEEAMEEVIKFPDVLVILSEGESSGNTEGSVIDHVAFRVQSLAEVEAAGFDVERLNGFQGIASVFTPEGERIELFDESATNLMFTLDEGFDDPVAERHNQSITVPVIAHHIHLYLPEGAQVEAKNWYTTMFGGAPGMRWRYDATDLPGINFNFSTSP